MMSALRPMVARGGHDLVVCPSSAPSVTMRSKRAAVWKAPQPGHGAGLDGGREPVEGP